MYRGMSHDKVAFYPFPAWETLHVFQVEEEGGCCSVEICFVIADEASSSRMKFVVATASRDKIV